MYTYLKRPRAHVKDVRVRRIMETVKLDRARSKSVSLPRNKLNTTRKKKKKKKKKKKERKRRRRSQERRRGKKEKKKKKKKRKEKKKKIGIKHKM